MSFKSDMQLRCGTMRLTGPERSAPTAPMPASETKLYGLRLADRARQPLRAFCAGMIPMVKPKPLSQLYGVDKRKF